jgi:hypothetical protein
VTASFEHGSARIYQFPVKFRAAIGGPREQIGSAAYVGSHRMPVAACGGGSAWYHEEAIQEERRETSPPSGPRVIPEGQ